MVTSVCGGEVSSPVAVASGVVSSVETTVSSVVGVVSSSLPVTAMPAPTPMPMAMTAATATSHHFRRIGGAFGGVVGVGGTAVRVVVIGAVAEIGGGGGGGTIAAWGTTTAGGGGTGGASTAVAVGPAPMRAAPSATASFGFDVNTTGRCS